MLIFVILLLLFFESLTRLCPVELVTPPHGWWPEVNLLLLSSAMLLGYDFCPSSYVIDAVNLISWMRSQPSKLAWKWQPKIKVERWKIHSSTMQLNFLLVMKCSCVLGTLVCALLLPGPGWTHDCPFFLFHFIRARAWGCPGSSPSHGRALRTTLFWNSVGQQYCPEISSNSLIFSTIIVSLALACP